MNINEISANNRLEIEYLSDDSFKRNMKGIVLATTEDKIVFITDTGDRIELDKDKILSAEKNNFEKIISDNLTITKNYYLEIYNLETKLEELKLQQEEHKQRMFDSKFISKFNIIGATNILNNYLKDFNTFRIGDSVFTIDFYNEDNNENEVFIKILGAKKFEFYNTENKEDLNRAMETYAPNKQKELEIIFPFIQYIFIERRHLERVSDDVFKAVTLYNGTIKLNKDNFVDIRNELKKSLQRLNKEEY